MSISKMFIPNFVCVFTNERYKTDQTGFIFCRLGHAPGVRLWDTGGTQGVPWGQVKGQISLNFSYHVNFKDVYTKFCVCFHKRKIQNRSDRIFILSPGSCPRDETLRHWGYPGGQTFFFLQTWSCSISNRGGWRAEQNASNLFILGSNWWPRGEVKRSNIINMSISKIFIPNFVCVLTNKR